MESAQRELGTTYHCVGDICAVWPGISVEEGLSESCHCWNQIGSDNSRSNMNCFFVCFAAKIAMDRRIAGLRDLGIRGRPP